MSGMFFGTQCISTVAGVKCLHTLTYARPDTITNSIHKCHALRALVTVRHTRIYALHTQNKAWAVQHFVSQQK